MNENKRYPRRSKADLLETGLTILAEHGEAALTIESICAALDVTKGSFYHHFGSRREFSRKLLEYWEEDYTRRFIELCDRAGSAADSYCMLDAFAEEVVDDVEVAVRAWALRDPLAREFQERIDETRINYLQRLHEDLAGDAAMASVLARLEYAAFIGSRQIMPRLNQKQVSAVIDLWTKMLNTFLSGEKT